MPKTISQKVVFKNTTTNVLYDFYMNAKKHSEVTGSPAKISDKESAKFSAYGDYCFGKNLQLIKNKLIVQSWRANDWSNEDVDSTFILLFEQRGEDVVVNMTHANVPDSQAKALAGGWKDFYWDPWKNFLAAQN